MANPSLLTVREYIVCALFIFVGCGGPTTLVSESADTATGSPPTGAPQGTTQASPSNGPPTQPGQTCSMVGAQEADLSAPYPYCRFDTKDNNYETYCRKQPGRGWAYMNWHTSADTDSLCHDDGTDCNTCLCWETCSVGDVPTNPFWTRKSCPTPSSGTAPAQCLQDWTGEGNGTCFVTCDEQESCPDGMSCVAMSEIGHQVCAWVTEKICE